MRHRTFVAMVGGVLAILPAVAASGGAVEWASQVSSARTREAALVEGFNPQAVQVNVNGSLPQVSTPNDLPLSADELPAAYVLPGGLLGIPGTALKAYRNAADIMAGRQPSCHIDWALIASIGRIESNHARGGYVDKNGTTLERILGPELNGIGQTVPIPDTDHGFYDLDAIWDRAVGPTQFIPSTWRGYASDGNGDGISDPNNIYDETLATARYLCSGGLDLSNPGQLRSSILRYNNSTVYVDIVLLWAAAYRNGVLPLADSPVPIGAPTPSVLPPPPALPSPQSPPAMTPATTPPSTPPPSSGKPPSDDPSSGDSGAPSSPPPDCTPPTTDSGSPTTEPTSTTPPPETTAPSTTTTPPTVVTVPPACAPPG